LKLSKSKYPIIDWKMSNLDWDYKYESELSPLQVWVELIGEVDYVDPYEEISLRELFVGIQWESTATNKVIVNL
jgi:hypothetical protein